MKECDIRLYALSTCIHCRNTKEFLNDCGVNYDCIDVDKLDKEERTAILEDQPKLLLPYAHYRRQGYCRF